MQEEIIFPCVCGRCKSCLAELAEMAEEDARLNGSSQFDVNEEHRLLEKSWLAYQEEGNDRRQ
jgi:hypothetical protein